MTEKLQIYKCEVCGNIVEVLHTGAGQLVCCGKPMKLFVENTVDAAKEKHVPVIEKTASGYTVAHHGLWDRPRGYLRHPGKTGHRPRVLQPARPLESLAPADAPN